MRRRNDILQRGQLYFIGRMARDADWHTHFAKGGDWLHLTPTHHLTMDAHKGFVFLEERTAQIYLDRLPFKLREQLGVYSCGAHRP